MDREKLIQEARKYRNLSKLIERNITEPELMTDFHILKSAPLLKRIEELEKGLRRIFLGIQDYTRNDLLEVMYDLEDLLTQEE